MMSEKESQLHDDILKQFMRFTDIWNTPEPEVGPTYRIPVWKKNKATLWYYPAKKKKYSIPLFLVYSLVNKAFILDLAPGTSMIEAFVNAGYDVYLLDFGIPGYEDKDISLDMYIMDYIQSAVKRAFRHSEAEELTVIAYCLGGTLAAIYAAVSEEPIKNLVLNVAPIDFHQYPVFDQWIEALKDGEIDHSIIDAIGIVPAKFMEAGMRMVSSPVYFSHYLSLLARADNQEYVDHWRRFNKWTVGHVPFPGKALKQLTENIGKDNKLVNGGMVIEGKDADLSNIHANLLVITAENDRLVPIEMSSPIMDLVSSKDKTLEVITAGHATFTVKDGLPPHLDKWLSKRSNPLY
ncbi:alpha/beta fold hydrolase [Bacillus gobiensis]|uniref:alpha/beta fold hydrolase n=2 Tax=Bacillus gobiensis TaxID=1441095 RepID=UPI003D206671